jgi:hypothetical protein
MTVTPSVVGPGNGQRNCSSIYWIWWFWTVSSCHHPVVRNCHIETFCLALVHNMLEYATMCQPCPQRPLGWPPALSSTIFHLEEANQHHWPTYSAKRKNYRVCSTSSKRSIPTKCEKCDVGLRILGCFEYHHKKARFGYITHGWSMYIHQTDNNKKRCMYIEF